ncbi:CATRA conflict system CASPASE/TPR repeat-associated protein [Kitasatospora sp. NPDC058965]|uniref:CATRA conflict system CASPASE/TPR repeat-associated protein n=1 Tax=Kitasatospora sp. NPDC058965 TaxID=3346682 RepID=UPI003673966D
MGTERTELRDPELVVHLWVRSDGPGADRAWAELRRIWSAARFGLHLTEPAHEPGGAELPMLPPRSPASRAGPVLCALQDDAGDAQVLLRRHLDLLVLSVIVSARPGDQHPWREPERRVDTVLGPGEGPFLGQARLFLAVAERVTAATRAAACAELGRGTPRPPAAERWIAPVPGLTVREFDTLDDGRPVRRFAVLAEAGREEAMSAWLWSDGSAALPPLAVYLAHAARIRHQWRVRHGDAGLAVALDRIDTAIVELGGGAGGADEPADALVRLGDAEAAAGVVRASAAAMARTVELELRNLAAADLTGAVHRPGGGDPFADDRRVAEDLLEHLADDRFFAGAAARRAGSARRAGRAIAPERCVFVVHGRDLAVRDEMFAYLRELGLEPLEWETLVTATRQTSPYVGEVLTQGLARARAVVVLLTPEDVVTLHPDLRGPRDSGRPEIQARPNVLIELGMALAVFPTRTLILHVGRVHRPVNDILGRNYVQLEDTERCRAKIVARLRGAGCPVTEPPPRGRRWFAGLAALHRRPEPSAPDD